MKLYFQIKSLFTVNCIWLYSKLYTVKNITGEDYIHAQKVFKEFEIKKLGEYHDLYFQSDTLLLAELFENFRNKCIQIYELDPDYLSAPGLAVATLFKKIGVKLELVTNNVLMIIAKRSRQGIYHAMHRDAKSNRK